MSILEGAKNLKVGMREELGNVPGISRSNALTLCVKMMEDEIVIFRDLVDHDEKYDFRETLKGGVTGVNVGIFIIPYI